MERTIFDILLIEDNPVDVVLIEDALGKASQVSFRLTSANQLSQGLNLLQQQHFDLVLLDLSPLGRQGLEAVHQLHAQVSNVPVLVLSDLPDETLALEILQAGAQDYLVKGQLGWDSLARVIRYAIERHQLQAALQKREQYYQSLIEYSANAVILLTVDGVILYESPAVLKILKYASDDLIGQNVFEFIHPNDQAISIELSQQLLQKPNISASREVRCRCKDGTYRWIVATATNLLNEPATRAFVINLHDITERKQQEELLLQINQRLGSAQRAAGAGIWEWDITTGQFNWSAEMFNLFGLDKIEPTFNEWRNSLHPADRQSAEEQIYENIRLHQQHFSEYRILLPSGEVRWINALGDTTYDENGTATRMAGICIDITERKRTEDIMHARLRLIQFADSHTLDELLQATLDEVETLTGSSIGFYHFLQADQKTLELQAWSTNTLQHMCQAEGKGRHYDVDEAGVWVDCVHQRQPVIHNDYDLLPHRKGLPKGHAPVIRELAVPVFRDNLIVAILGVGNKEQPYFSADVEAVSLFADLAWDIAERKQAEEGLNKIQQLLKETEQIGKVGGWEFNIDSRQQIWTEEIYNIHEVDLPYNPIVEKGINFYTPASRPIIEQAVQRAIEHGEPFDLELEIITAKGNLKNVHAVGKADLQHHRVYGFFQDITKEKQAESKLLESEKRYRTLVESSPDCIGIHCEGKVVYANAAAAKLFHAKEREDLIGLPIIQFIHPEYRSLAIERIRNSYENNQPSPSLEEKFVTLDGEPIDVEVSTTPITHNGKVATQIIIRNITERRHAEKILRESEERFRKVFEEGPLGIVMARVPDGKFLRVNAAFCQMLGYTEEEISRLTFIDVTHPDDRAKDMQEIARLREGKIPRYQTEKRYLKKNGEAIWGALTATLVRTEKMEPLHFLGMIKDITERKQAEETILRNEQVLRLFVEYSPAAIAMLDRDMKYIVASHRYLIDYSLGDISVTGRSHYEIFPEIPERWKEIHRRCLAGAVEKADEDPFPRANGKLDWVRWEIHPWHDVNGEIGGIILFSEVITERKEAKISLQKAHDELEQRVIERTADLSQANAELDRANIELKHANRLKDEFLASMSHELRTPLTGILGLSESLQLNTYGELNEKQLKAMRNIEKSGQHLLALINDILDLSKIEAGKLEIRLEPCSVSEICQSSLQLTKEMAEKKRQRVGFTMKPTAITITADARRLKQMLVNLLSNAIKFTPEDGQIGLEVQGDKEARVVKFIVWDKGIGIKPEDVQEIFKPFVQLDGRLARQYSGTGLGLSLVKRMADLHNGSVEVESVFGEGSRFTILLPWMTSE